MSINPSKYELAAVMDADANWAMRLLCTDAPKVPLAPVRVTSATPEGRGRGKPRQALRPRLAEKKLVPS